MSPNLKGTWEGKMQREYGEEEGGICLQNCIMENKENNEKLKYCWVYLFVLFLFERKKLKVIFNTYTPNESA